MLLQELDAWHCEETAPTNSNSSNWWRRRIQRENRAGRKICLIAGFLWLPVSVLCTFVLAVIRQPQADTLQLGNSEAPVATSPMGSPHTHIATLTGLTACGGEVPEAGTHAAAGPSSLGGAMHRSSSPDTSTWALRLWGVTLFEVQWRRLPQDPTQSQTLAQLPQAPAEAAARMPASSSTCVGADTAPAPTALPVTQESAAGAPADAIVRVPGSVQDSEGL